MHSKVSHAERQTFSYTWIIYKQSIFPSRTLDSCHATNFAVTGVTVGCHNDSHRYHQWRQSWHDYINMSSENNWGLWCQNMARFLSLAGSKLRLCSANHRPVYWSNLPCDWPSTSWAYSEQKAENGTRYQGFWHQSPHLPLLSCTHQCDRMNRTIPSLSSLGALSRSLCFLVLLLPLFPAGFVLSQDIPQMSYVAARQS